MNFSSDSDVIEMSIDQIFLPENRVASRAASVEKKEGGDMSGEVEVSVKTCPELREALFNIGSNLSAHGCRLSALERRIDQIEAKDATSRSISEEIVKTTVADFAPVSAEWLKLVGFRTGFTKDRQFWVINESDKNDDKRLEIDERDMKLVTLICHRYVELNTRRDVRFLCDLIGIPLKD